MDQQALIDAIAAEPRARFLWEVYADWLLDRGDPRGELIHLELAIESGLADPDALEQVRGVTDEALVSPRLRAQLQFWQLEFRRGFIRCAMLTDAPTFATAGEVIGVEAIDALFADQHAALLDTLNLRQGETSQSSLASAALAAPRHALRQLRIGDLGSIAARLNENAPALEQLAIHASSEGDAVGILAHDNVRDLSSCTSACPAVCTGTVSLPRLESLTWEIIGDDALLRPGSLLFHPPPGLATIALELLSDDEWGRPDVLQNNVVALLATSPVARQIRSLSVTSPHFGHIADLCDRASAFPQLVKFEASTVSVYGPRLDAVALRALSERFERTFAGIERIVSWDSIERMNRSGEWGEREPRDSP